MTILQYLMVILIILVMMLAVISLMQVMKKKKINNEFSPVQRSMVNFILKINEIDREDRERFLAILDSNQIKRVDRFEHLVISKKIFKIGFATLKKPKDIEFINSIEEKLFSRKTGF